MCSLLSRTLSLLNSTMAGLKFLSLFLLVNAIYSVKSSSIPSQILPLYSPAPAPLALPPLSTAVKGGYWPASLAESHPPSSIPTQYFTHLFYAFLELDPTTYQLALTPLDHQWMKNFTTTLHSKTPKPKAFLSIGGGNSNPTAFSNMVSNSDNRAAFIKSTINVARQYYFDGLDLDWEFPNTPLDMSNLAILFAEWRASVNDEALASDKPCLLLSAGVYFASDFFLSDIPRSYPGDAIKNYVDFVSPMCYDYHGSWEPSTTGAQALLYDNSSNVSTSFGISSWMKIVPSEKLVMGLPMYGRTWELKGESEHGIGAPAIGIGPGEMGVLVYSEIVAYNSANNATEVFDVTSVSTYSFAGTVWIGYDNATSIAKKVEFAKNHGLGGYFFWAVGYDRDWTLAKTASEAWDNKN